MKPCRDNLSPKDKAKSSMCLFVNCAKVVPLIFSLASTLHTESTKAAKGMDQNPHVKHLQKNYKMRKLGLKDGA